MAATGYDRIDIQIGIDPSALRRGLGNANQSVKNSTDQMRNGFRSAGRAANDAGNQIQATGRKARAASGNFSYLASRLKTTIAGFIGLHTALSAIRNIDTISLINSRMKSLLGSTEEAKDITDKLYRSAQELGVPYEAMASSVAKLVPAVRELGGGTEEAVRLGEILAITARLSGSSAQEAASSMRQFSQALGSGVLQGDELKSIMENNQQLALRLASALKVGVGELKEMGAQGKLTGAVVGNALAGSYDELKAQAKDLDRTVGQSWQIMINSINRYLFASDQAGGATEGIKAAMVGLAEVVDDLALQLFEANQELKTMKDDDFAGMVREMVQFFHGLTAIVKTVTLQFRGLAHMVRSVGQALAQIVTFDFEGADKTLIDGWAEVTKMIDSAAKSVGKYMGIQKEVPPGPNSGENTHGEAKTLDGGKRTKLKGKAPKNEVSDEAKAAIAAYTAQTRAFRNNLEERMRLTLEQAELVKAAYGEESVEYQRMLGRITALKRQMAAQDRDLSRITTEVIKDDLLAQVDTEQAVLNAREQAGFVTHARVLQAESLFEQRRYAIRLSALQQNLALAEQDPDRSPVKVAQIQAQIEALESQHAGKVAEIRAQIAGERGIVGQGTDAFWSGMESGFNSMIGRMADGSLRLRDVWGTAMRGMLNLGIKTVASMVGNWIFGETAKTTVTATQAGVRTGIEAGAAVKSVAINSGAAIKNIMISAWEGMAAAYKAIAGIPYVGPFLAPAAAGVAFAGIAGLAGKIASAEGGYDIPAGVNPITQLHEKEMVLPRKQADAVRAMANGDGSMGTGGSMTVNFPISTPDGQGVDRFLRDNRPAIQREVKRIMREAGVEA